MKQLILILFVAAIAVSCEETVNLDLKQVPDRVVIEGIVTNAVGKQFIRLTKSGGFYQTGNTVRITNANVTVTDNTGETIPFIHNRFNSEDSVGYYLPAAGFKGIVGRIYTLHVSVDGQLYEGSDTLKFVAPIDSLGWQINRFRERDNPTDGKVYELLIYAKEPQETQDSYLVKYYRNDSLVYDRETDVYLFNDYGVGENIDGIPSNVYYALDDVGKVELYSITRTGFLFYNDLFSVLNNDGGMFSPPPANPRTNLTNGAMGYFQASAVNARTIKLEQNK